MSLRIPLDETSIYRTDISLTLSDYRNFYLYTIGSDVFLFTSVIHLYSQNSVSAHKLKHMSSKPRANKHMLVNIHCSIT